MEVYYVENIEYKYCGSKPKMKVDLTHENQGRVSRVSRSELRRVPEQRKLGSSDVLDNRLAYQHELRRVPEPSNVLVAHPVRIGNATLLGAQSCKGLGAQDYWESGAIGKIICILNSSKKKKFYWK
jgi:hypothetical protein